MSRTLRLGQDKDQPSTGPAMATGSHADLERRRARRVAGRNATKFSSPVRHAHGGTTTCNHPSGSCCWCPFSPHRFVAMRNFPAWCSMRGSIATKGRCGELRRPETTERQACQSHAGVVATGQNEVAFMLDSVAGDSVVFRSSQPPEYRSDNDLAV
jgi:hypothetical protein